MRASCVALSLSTCPPFSLSPPRSQLFHRSYSNTHTYGIKPPALSPKPPAPEEKHLSRSGGGVFRVQIEDGPGGDAEVFQVIVPGSTDPQRPRLVLSFSTCPHTPPPRIQLFLRSSSNTTACRFRCDQEFLFVPRTRGHSLSAVYRPWCLYPRQV